MQTSIKPFQKEYFDFSQIREREKKVLEKEPNFIQALLSMKANANLYTFFIGDNVLAHFGVYPVNDFNEFWQIPTIEVNNYPIQYSKAAREITENLLGEYLSLTVHAPVDKLHNRWLRFLGFNPIKNKYCTSVIGEAMQVWEKTWQ